MRDAELPEKALLLLDNAPSHPAIEELCSDDGKIVTMLLPPNVTALIQPMDQNVIRLTKLYYRTSLLSMIAANKEKDIGKVLKALTLKDAAFYLAKHGANLHLLQSKIVGSKYLKLALIKMDSPRTMIFRFRGIVQIVTT